MTQIIERTILFADLRGSTALYETLGNAEATSVVTPTRMTSTESASIRGSSFTTSRRTRASAAC